MGYDRGPRALDGATSHTARISMDAVNALFPGRVIARKGDIAWPPKSPDLTLRDFFLWGHLGNPSRTIPALKQRIREEVAAMPVNMLRGIMQHFVARLEKSPTLKTILRTAKKFNEKVFVLNLNKGSSGRLRTVRTQVRMSVNQSPKTGYRKRARELKLRPTSIRRILKEELKLTHINCK
ncbi:hypothetical protein ANN_13238 [Periplaneta americana]|uniref:Uncharacterized protein n=1 Tax=Periplaneta americana TaxID=6978 RepID=A0ABQ8TKP1_PERAM|nr:hypothetical protein ANN_13238 [Periplaneta americana]